MKHIWAFVFILAVAIGVSTYHETAGSSLRWIALITGSMLIVGAVLTGLSLRFSEFGRWFLGRLWPGQFSDGKQKRVATSLVLVLLLAYVLWGTGTILRSLAGSSPLVEQIGRPVAVVGALGACGILWAQSVFRR